MDRYNDTTTNQTLSAEQLQLIDAWWRAANYLSIGQIYLLDNPLLNSGLKLNTSSHGCSVIGERRRDLISSMST